MQNPDFGSRIKELRKMKGFSQKYVAEQLGVTPTQISDIENSKTSPSFSRAVALAILFDTSLDYLAGIPATQHPSEIEVLFNSLAHDQQMRVMGYIDALLNK